MKFNCYCVHGCTNKFKCLDISERGIKRTPESIMLTVANKDNDDGKMISIDIDDSLIDKALKRSEVWLNLIVIGVCLVFLFISCYLRS